MQPSPKQLYDDTLYDGISSLGLGPYEASIDVIVTKLYQHYSLVDKWSDKINLTTVYDPQLAAVRHALDSLLFGQAINQMTGIGIQGFVDVGSGAGFPGIPLAITFPSYNFVLLEPIRKRASFLRVVVAELQLKNVKVVEGRLDEKSCDKLPRVFPTMGIVSRATIPPLKFLPLVQLVLQTGGMVVTSGGVGLPELTELEASAGELVHELRLSFVLVDGSNRTIDRFRRL